MKQHGFHKRRAMLIGLATALLALPPIGALWLIAAFAFSMRSFANYSTTKWWVYILPGFAFIVDYSIGHIAYRRALRRYRGDTSKIQLHR